jgi:predicted  nucleic acid-binding Zn-ribbon protein
MQPRSIEERLTMLERQMQHLPERVTILESQFMQFREAMRHEFSAIRTEMKRADDDTRVFMRVLYEDVLSRLEMLGEGDGSDSSGQ